MTVKGICILIVTVFILWPGRGTGQKLQYGGMQQLSVIFGDNYTGTGFSFINGVRFRKFFAGVGADALFKKNYYYNINPYNCSAVFVDLRYYINKNKNFFAKADGGVNLINQRLGSTSRSNTKKLAGSYLAVGVGFKARLGKEVFYSFDINYAIRETRWINNYIDFRNEWQDDKYSLIQPTILINMGIEIF
jgi:hypothetical protein